MTNAPSANAARRDVAGRRILQLSEVRREDGRFVGGKNASLGEMIGELAKAGIRVPDGFAVTASAYREFIAYNKLEENLRSEFARYDKDSSTLASVGKTVRTLILDAELQPDLRGDIIAAYRRMAEQAGREPSVAVRSSATAEDLPEASFAGQLETLLNVKGEAALLDACRKCFSSLFTDRAISYRRNQGFGQLDVAVSVGVQLMVRSDKAASGVMFSIDTDSGFPDVVLINGGWGLGETVVQGMIDPDEFEVFKPLLDEQDSRPIIHKRRLRRRPAHGAFRQGRLRRDVFDRHR